MAIVCIAWNGNEKNKQNERVIKLSIVYRNVYCVRFCCVTMWACVCIIFFAWFSFFLAQKSINLCSIWNECVYTIWHVNWCKKCSIRFTSIFIYFPFYDIEIRSQVTVVVFFFPFSVKILNMLFPFFMYIFISVSGILFVCLAQSMFTLRIEFI